MPLVRSLRWSISQLVQYDTFLSISRGRACRNTRCISAHALARTFAPVTHRQLSTHDSPQSSTTQPSSAPSPANVSPNEQASNSAQANDTPSTASNTAQHASAASSASNQASVHLSGDSGRARGPITWRSVLLLLLSGGIGVGIYQYEKDRKLHSASNQRSVGSPLLGGPYQLTDMYGRAVDSTVDYAGRYQLIYFGFTHCPDICPAELEKMQLAVEQFNQANKGSAHKPVLVPLFISIDPKRDTLERLQKYSREWSPSIQWLTGSDEQVRDVAKKFRVYYSSPEWASGTDDAYLVDHSIFFYLMDRQGEFMQYFGKNMSAEDIALKMTQLIREDNGV